MARRLRRRAIIPNSSLHEPFRPDKAPALDPAIFRTAFYRIVEKLSDETPLSEDSLPRIDLEQPRGSVQHIQLTDNPMTRAMLALNELFPDDEEKMMNAFLRYEALLDIASRGNLGMFVIEEEWGKQVHDALIEAAAVSPMTKNGVFLRPVLLYEAQRRV